MTFRKRDVRGLLPYLLIGATSTLLSVFYTLTRARNTSLGGDSYYFYYWPAVQLARGNGFISSESIAFFPGGKAFLATHSHLSMSQFYTLGAQLDYPVKVPGAAHPPGFISLLAVLYKIGFHTPLSLSLAMCVLGGCTVALTGLLVRRLAGNRAGIIATVIAAVYPGMWIVQTRLLSETLMMFGFVLGLLGFYRFRDHASWKNVALSSLGFTLMASARPESILLVPFGLAPALILGRQRASKRALGHLAVAACIPILVFGAWMAYNRPRFAHPVLLSTGFGQTAMVGSCDHVFKGPWIGYYSITCPDDYPQPPKTSKGYLDGSVLNAFDTREVLHYVSEHRAQVPTVVLAREARMLGAWNPEQTIEVDHFIEQRGTRRLVTFTLWSFWILAATGLIGAVVLRRRGVPIYPLLVEVGITFLATALTFGQTRYRVGIDFVAVILAAVAIDAIWKQVDIWWSHRPPPTPL